MKLLRDKDYEFSWGGPNSDPVFKDFYEKYGGVGSSGRANKFDPYADAGQDVSDANRFKDFYGVYGGFREIRHRRGFSNGYVKSNFQKFYEKNSGMYFGEMGGGGMFSSIHAAYADFLTKKLRSGGRIIPIKSGFSASGYLENPFNGLKFARNLNSEIGKKFKIEPNRFFKERFQVPGYGVDRRPLFRIAKILRDKYRDTPNFYTEEYQLRGEEYINRIAASHGFPVDSAEYEEIRLAYLRAAEIQDAGAYVKAKMDARREEIKRILEERKAAANQPFTWNWQTIASYNFANGFRAGFVNMMYKRHLMKIPFYLRGLKRFRDFGRSVARLFITRFIHKFDPYFKKYFGKSLGKILNFDEWAEIWDESDKKPDGYVSDPRFMLRQERRFRW